jgi:hypothetical protein
VIWATNVVGDLDRAIEVPYPRTRDMGGVLAAAVIDATGRSSAA